MRVLFLGIGGILGAALWIVLVLLLVLSVIAAVYAVVRRAVPDRKTGEEADRIDDLF